MHARLNNVDPGDRERRFLFETGKAHTLETLQDQIGCAIAAPDARANQPDGRKMKEVFGCMPLGATRLYKRDAKHAMMAKRVIQHLAISRLEDIERKQRMRKEDRSRKRHHRQLFWQNFG